MNVSVLLLLLVISIQLCDARLRGEVSTPSGVYSGSKTVLGKSVNILVTVGPSHVLSFKISGAASVNCPSENYSMNGNEIEIPGASDKNDCLGKNFESANIELKKCTYSPSDDTISVSVKYQHFLSESLVLKSESNSLLFAVAEDSSSCTADDISKLKSHDFAGDMKTCGKKCWGASSCVSKCMIGKESISSACAKCFGAEAQCTRDHCMSKCSFSPDSDSCKQCAVQNCQSAETTCSGFVPTAQMPSILFEQERSEMYVAFAEKTPAGTYMGEKSFLGKGVNLKITIDDSAHFDMIVTGFTSLDCKNEQYSLSGGNVNIPGAKVNGNCIHDALLENKMSLGSVTYDATSDEISLSVKYGTFVHLNVVLKK